MKRVAKGVFLITLIIATTVAWQQFQPKPTKIISEDSCEWFTPGSIGNRLVEHSYFTNTNHSFDKQESKRCDCDKQIADDVLRDFYSKLIWTHKNKLIACQSTPQSAWNQINEDGSDKDNYLQFWRHVRPQLKEFYEQNIDQIEVSVPIIHFRCSDAPFVRNNEMHLVKASTVKWMAEKIKSKGHSKVIMLNCKKHLRGGNSSQKACAAFTDFYVEQFREHGIEVELQCNDLFKDFAMMIYSPLLVSLNASSFSFIAGVSKNPEDYVACNMGAERNGRYYLQTEADWDIDNNEPLLHNDVERYGRINNVIEMLRK